MQTMEQKVKTMDRDELAFAFETAMNARDYDLAFLVHAEHHSR